MTIVEPNDSDLDAQIARLRALLIDLQFAPGASIPPQLTSALFDFSITTVEQRAFELGRAMAGMAP